MVMGDTDYQSVDSLRGLARTDNEVEEVSEKKKKKPTNNKKKKKEQNPAPVPSLEGMPGEELAQNPHEAGDESTRPVEPEPVTKKPRAKRPPRALMNGEDIAAVREVLGETSFINSDRDPPLGAVPHSAPLPTVKPPRSTNSKKQAADSSDEDKCFRIRCKIDRYYVAFGGTKLFTEPPKLTPKSSLEDHRLALKAVESELDGSGAMNGFKMMVSGLFTVLESISAQRPELGLDLHGEFPLTAMLQSNDEILEPTYEEFVIKHADWFTMSVERRLALELIQVVVATRQLNSNPALAEQMTARVPSELKQKGAGL